MIPDPVSYENHENINKYQMKCNIFPSAESYFLNLLFFMKQTVLFILMLIPLFAFSQTIEKKTYVAKMIQTEIPKVDGKLNDVAWGVATWDDHFTQYEPYEGGAPSQQTSFAVVYDRYNIYIGMKMFDTSPDSIVQRLTRRDMMDGDIAGFEIDTYDDKRTAFAFGVSAAGVKWDFITSNDGDNEDDTWNPIWWVEVSKDSLGWYAEMRIPLTQLRFNMDEGMEWGFNPFRFLFRKEEVSLWQAVTKKRGGFVSQFGRIKGFQEIESRNIVDIMPYVVAKTERFEKVPDDPFRSKGFQNSLNGGLDAKIGLTNSLTLDMTVNPDFGQVEADPSEVNLTTYETFFQERRPFFIEGKSILNFGLNFGDGDLSDEGMFYSRRIGRPPHYYPEVEENSYIKMPEFTRILGAAKISGKNTKGWSVGLLESMTAKEYARIKNSVPEYKVPVEPFTNYAVGRLQKDFNQGNTWLGGMLTAVNRNLENDELSFLHKSAYAGGIDFVHKWDNRNWSFETSVYGSRVAGSEEAILHTQQAWTRLFQRPDASYLGVDSTRTSLSGFGGKILLGEYGGNVRFMNGITWKSPGLELNDVGYLREADNILQVFWIQYRILNPVSIFRQFMINLNQWTEWNFGGELTSPGGNINLHTTFTNYWNFHFGTNLNLYSISSSALRGGPSLKLPGNFNVWAAFGSSEQKKLTCEMETSFNTGTEKGYNQSSSIQLSVSYKPLKSLNFSISPGYTFSRTILQYVTQQEINGNSRYLFSALDRNTLSTSFRVNFNLTPELSLQYWGQPFIATGKYDHFKKITDSRADNLNGRFREYIPSEIAYNTSDESYVVTENGWGTFSFGKPDFNVKEFLSNMVIRWEYTPGSTLYLVWSQDRSSSVNDGSFDLGQDLDRLFGTKARNIFLVKLSYRFGR